MHKTHSKVFQWQRPPILTSSTSYLLLHGKTFDGNSYTKGMQAYDEDFLNKKSTLTSIQPSVRVHVAKQIMFPINLTIVLRRLSGCCIATPLTEPSSFTEATQTFHLALENCRKR